MAIWRDGMRSIRILDPAQESDARQWHLAFDGRGCTGYRR
jgi:hypothetical protein